MTITALALSLMLLTAPAQAADSDWVLRDRGYQTFLIDLQSAVKTGNRLAVVKLVTLPLRVNGSRGRSAIYRSDRSIQRDYARIFNASVRRAILQQRLEELFGRDQGVMIGLGKIWFDHVCSRGVCTATDPVRIFAVNP